MLEQAVTFAVIGIAVLAVMAAIVAVVTAEVEWVAGWLSVLEFVGAVGQVVVWSSVMEFVAVGYNLLLLDLMGEGVLECQVVPTVDQQLVLNTIHSYEHK